MGVDLHPSGERFVFDLLGDLYELPVEGGTAQRLTSGPAWDSEARYSPDGNTLVFSSDRGGNRNLWFIDGDGERPRALTSEKNVRLSDPAWVPDGDYVVARRRITDSSSIGVHELWLYHRLGGKGVQLTNSQRRAGVAEPALSPDGRSLYFSERRSRYAYNRDPNKGIWQLARLDRPSGQLRPLTGEFGGAVRPTPSPDGASLAIVRRVRHQTVLEIYDLVTGHRRRIADWLDRDEQEGFAVNGLYPRMDWFPDGKSLLLWAKGGFWKVNATSGDREAIPFEAQVEQEIQQAVRSPRSPVAERVRARLIRWPVLSPDGKTLVFGALGLLWVMDLPDGMPRRLTRDSSPREYGPAWSRDGKRIAFVSWDDEEGGALRVVSARGGRSKRVTRTAAKYANPSFSPDGKEVVLLRGSGSHRRGGELAWELWSDIVLVDLKSGVESVVTSTGGKRGARPRFSPDGKRILFPESKGQGRDAAKGVLLSVNRDGTDRREILEVGNAVDIVPSPDGAWVAFVEQHHAWVAAVPETGRKSFAVTRDAGGTPGWRLSKEAGDWVDFTADSRRVTWNYGPEFHQLALADLVAWEEERQEDARKKKEEEEASVGGEDEGSPDAADDDDDSAEAGSSGAEDEDEDKDKDKELPPSLATEMLLEVPRAVPQGVIALTSARVITMRGDEVLEGHTLVTSGDRILALGPDGSVEIPEDAHRVDAAGTTIIPGLIDVHAHMHFSAHDVMPEQDWRYYANLAYGVTTIHDPSAISDQVFSYGELVETGDMVGPRIFSTGQILYGAGGAFRSEVGKLEDARRHVRRMKQLGAISVKSYQQPRREQRQWIVQACREEGMLNIPEGGGDLLDNFGMVLDGHSAIEHALPVAPLYRDVVELFAGSDTYYSPTLLVAYGGASGEHYFYAQEPVWGNERLAAFTPQGTLDARSRRLTLVAADDDWHHQEVARSAAAIQDAGGKVTLGGHGQLQGLGAHWELWALGGPGAMSAHEALRAATIDGANYLGMGADLGSIEVGKLADFVVLEKNPLEKIEHSDSIRQVVKGGVLYDASTMHRTWPNPASRGRFMWEVAAGKDLPPATLQPGTP